MAWPGISRAKQIAQECPPLSDLVPPDSGDEGHRRRDDLSESGSACLDIGRGDHASPVYVAREAQRWSAGIGQFLQAQEYAAVIIVIG
jgi:hypothetical protein